MAKWQLKTSRRHSRIRMRALQRNRELVTMKGKITCRLLACCSTCPQSPLEPLGKAPRRRKRPRSLSPEEIHVLRRTRSRQHTHAAPTCSLSTIYDSITRLNLLTSSAYAAHFSLPPCTMEQTHTQAVPVDTPLPMAPRNPLPLNPVAVPKIHPMIHGPMKPLTVAPITCHAQTSPPQLPLFHSIPRQLHPPPTRLCRRDSISV